MWWTHVASDTYLLQLLQPNSQGHSARKKEYTPKVTIKKVTKLNPHKEVIYSRNKVFHLTPAAAQSPWERPSTPQYITLSSSLFTMLNWASDKIKI